MLMLVLGSFFDALYIFKLKIFAEAKKRTNEWPAVQMDAKRESAGEVGIGALGRLDQKVERGKNTRSDSEYVHVCVCVKEIDPCILYVTDKCMCHRNGIFQLH